MIPQTPPKIRFVESCDVRLLLDDPHNPNVMPDSVLDVLRKVIGTAGFLQPVLVREAKPHEITTEFFAAAATISERRPIHYAPIEGYEGPYYIIIDGHHRIKAIRDSDLTHIPVVVVDVDANFARVIQLEMNRLRGDLDLAAVARNLQFLDEEVGLSDEDLAFTGFSPDELSALLADKGADPNEDVMNDPVGSSDENAPPDKPFVLELTFGTKIELARAKKGLRRAAGGGRKPDLARGLLALIAGDDGD